MICDLSCPTGHSVSDGIASELCSLQYSTVDKAVEIVKILGTDVQLVKLNIKDAYRIVPIHPADLPFLGIRWRDNVYIDRALPFGLRSGLKLFTAVADLIAWVLACQGVMHQLHYLDDFLFITTPHPLLGHQDLHIALQTLRKLGIPVAVNKTEEPCTSLTFLGIVIDCHNFELRLPADKLACLQQTIWAWCQKQSCMLTKRTGITFRPPIPRSNCYPTGPCTVLPPVA